MKPNGPQVLMLGVALVVLARTMQLQDAVSVLELDRVLDGASGDIESHRVGLAAARTSRIGLVGRTTARLLVQMDETIVRANSRVLLNPFDSPAAVKSSNELSDGLTDFRVRVGIESDYEHADARSWRRSVAETGEKVVTTGVTRALAAKKIGARGLEQASEAFRAVDADGDGVAERPRARVAAEGAGDALKGAAVGVSDAFGTLFKRGRQRSVGTSGDDDQSA